MERSTKVIVTHRAALHRKHGAAGMRKIDAALRRLSRADAKRGVATRCIAIDRAADMAPFGRRVSNRKDARQAKRAVDEICRALKPDYLMLLGAPDVIPHVGLRNPMAASRDSDRRIDSDLPYACDAPYSTSIKDFLGPTRVVGRLPDVMGAGRTGHLVRLLDTARAWQSRPRSDYGGYFSLSTASWRRSTETTTRKLFGNDEWVRLSPSEGPYWTAADLEGRVHLINCHGDTADPQFYGEDEYDLDDQPSAHAATHLTGRIQPATVVAAECCYGAEIYEPTAGRSVSICQTYLDEGAWAFFGSTTVAYGPAEGNNFADLICGSFLREVLGGASVGRAVLEARQKYIRLGGYMEMVDLKTIAQFLLLGDPSIHPVQAATSSGRAAGHAAGHAAGKTARAVGARRARRKRLARSGHRIGVTTAFVASRADAKTPPRLRIRFRKLAAARDASAQAIESFKLHAPAERIQVREGRQLVARHAVFHVIVLKERRSAAARRLTERRSSGSDRRPRVQRLLVVREVGGVIKRVVEAVRH
jgi:Peptidase family C25